MPLRSMTGAMKTNIHFLKTSGLLVALILIAALTCRPVAAEGKFLSAINDFPLMSELDEIAGGVLVFDSPSGRIVEALTMGKVSIENVKQFYSATLPQLGWKEVSPGRFSREGESLRLEFPKIMDGSNTPSGNETSTISVLFMLSPEK